MASRRESRLIASGEGRAVLASATVAQERPSCKLNTILGGATHTSEKALVSHRCQRDGGGTNS